MLEGSIFTWSEELEANFGTYIDSKDFKNSVLQRKWVKDINLVERIAKDQVIRGYFVDDDLVCNSDSFLDLKFSVLKQDL